MKILIFIVLFFLGANQAGAAERIGTDQGNGGDSFAAEFVSIARSIMAFVNTQSFLPESEKVKFMAAVNNSQVESTEEELFLRAVPKDALNFPAEGRILFNRARWASFGLRSKYALVLHEYFSLIGKESGSYGISARILEGLFLGQPRCAFLGGGLPGFLRPPRHMNSRLNTVAEAVYLGVSFALRVEGKQARLEARNAEGELLAAASGSLDSESLHADLNLSLLVKAANGLPIEVACSTRALIHGPER